MSSSKPITDSKVQATPSPAGAPSAPSSTREGFTLARSPNDDTLRARYPPTMSSLSSTSSSEARSRSASKSSETWSPRDERTTPGRECGSIVQGMISRFQQDTSNATTSSQPIRQRVSVTQQQTASPDRSCVDSHLRTPGTAQKSMSADEGLSVNTSANKDLRRSPFSRSPSHLAVFNQLSASTHSNVGTSIKSFTPFLQPKGQEISPLELFPSLGALDAAGLLADSKTGGTGVESPLPDLHLHMLTPIGPAFKPSFAETGLQHEDLTDDAGSKASSSKQTKSKLVKGWKKLRDSIRQGGTGLSGSKRDSDGPQQQQTLSCPSMERQPLGEGLAMPERKAVSDMATAIPSSSSSSAIQALGPDFGLDFSLTLESLGSTFGSDEFRSTAFLKEPSSSPSATPPLSPSLSSSSTSNLPSSSTSHTPIKDLLTISKTVTKTPSSVAVTSEDAVNVEGGVVYVDFDAANKVGKISLFNKQDNMEHYQQQQLAGSSDSVDKLPSEEQATRLHSVDSKFDLRMDTAISANDEPQNNALELYESNPLAEDKLQNSVDVPNLAADAKSAAVEIESTNESLDRGSIYTDADTLAADRTDNSAQPASQYQDSVQFDSVSMHTQMSPLSEKPAHISEPELSTEPLPPKDSVHHVEPELMVEIHQIQAPVPSLDTTASSREESSNTEAEHVDPMPIPTRRTNLRQHSNEQQFWRLSIEGMPCVYGTICSKRAGLPDDSSLHTPDPIAEEDELVMEPEAVADDRSDNAFKVPLAQSVQLASAMFGNGKRIPLSLYYISEELRMRDLSMDIPDLFPLSWQEVDTELDTLLTVFDNRPFGQGYDISETKSITKENGSSEKAVDGSHPEQVVQSGVSSRHLSCVVLWFLKELSDPLIPTDILDSLSNIARLQSADDVKSKAAAALMQALPEDNLNLLQFLIEFVDLTLLRPIREDIQQSRETLALALEEEAQCQQKDDTDDDRLKAVVARVSDLQQSISGKQQQLDELQSRLVHTLSEAIAPSSTLIRKKHMAEVLELVIQQRHDIFGPATFSLSADLEHDETIRLSRRSSVEPTDSDQSTVVFVEEDERGYHSDSMITKTVQSARRNHKRILRSLRLRVSPGGDDTVWELNERGNFVRKKQREDVVADDPRAAEKTRQNLEDLAALSAIHDRIRQMHQLSNRHQRRNSVATVHSIVADAHSIADIEEEDRSAAIERANQGLADALNGKQSAPPPGRNQSNPSGGFARRFGFKDFLQEPLERKREQKELKMVEKEILQSESIGRHLVSSLSGLYPSTNHTHIPLSILPSARKQIQLNDAMAAASAAAVNHLFKSIPPPAEHVYANPDDNKDPRVRPPIEQVWKPQETIVIPADHREGNKTCTCTYCKHVAQPSRIPLPTKEEHELAGLKAECEAKDQHVVELLKTVHDLQGQVNVLNAKLLFLHDHHTTRPMRKRTLARLSQPLLSPHQHQYQQQQHQFSVASTESSDERRFQQLHLRLKEARRGSINSQKSSVNEFHHPGGGKQYSPQSSDVNMHRTDTPVAASNQTAPQPHLMASPPSFATPSSLLRAFPDGVSFANNTSTNLPQHSHATTTTHTIKDPSLRHHTSLPLLAGFQQPPILPNIPGTDMDDFILDADETMSHLDLDQDQNMPQCRFNTLVESRSLSQLQQPGRTLIPSSTPISQYSQQPAPSSSSQHRIAFGNNRFNKLSHVSHRSVDAGSSITAHRIESEIEMALREMEEAEEADIYAREGEDQADEYYYADAYKTMDQRLYRRPALPVIPAPPPMTTEQYRKHQRMSLPIQSLMSRRITLANTFKWRSSRAALA